MPSGFRFSVKMPKGITHDRKLVDCDGPIGEFLEEVSALGQTLAVLVVQLPPKLMFDPEVAARFFSVLAKRTQVAIACEPRHISWFGTDAEELLERFNVARVAADPAICSSAARPGAWTRLSYWRLHGSPIIYRSSYMERLETYAAELTNALRNKREVWCIFDNTAASAGASDALALSRAIE